MGIVTWVLVGLVFGVIANFIAGKDSIVTNIIIGVVGAALGGWIATLFGLGTFTVFSIWNLLISGGGALVLLLAFNLIRRGREA